MNRRTFLGGVGGAVGAATLAGCAGILQQGVDASSGTQWLPSPNEISLSEFVPSSLSSSQASGYSLNQYDAVMTSPTSVSNHRGVLGPEAWQRYRSRWVDMEYAFPTAGELDVVVSGVGEAGEVFRVGSGSFNADRIRARLTADSFETASGDIAEYSYYLREDGQVGYALTGSNIVVAQIPSSLLNTPGGVASPDPAEFNLVGLLDIIIESERGITDRYGENDSDLIPLADQGLSGDYILYDYHPDRFQGESPADLNPVAGEFPSYVATGQSQTLSGETTERTLALVFQNEQAFLENPIESNIETYVSESPQFRNWRELDWERDAETVVIEGALRSVDAWPTQTRNENP
jgi:hypothetical protein